MKKNTYVLQISFFAVMLLFSVASWGQFSETGDATATDCNCFQVTEDLESENGSFYQTATIDLNDAFHYKFSVNFGCTETGGEGLAFVLQSGAWATGAGDYGIGYQDIVGNSLTLEFDTRDNEASGEIDNWDVASDHISLQDNGDIDHEAINPNNLLGSPSGLNLGETPTPHPIKPGFPNIEDCEDHTVEIIWTPGTNQTIQVRVDGILSLTYIGDMITDQFGGSPTVRWGWTGATGSLSNEQTVCLALEPEFEYSATACPDETTSFTSEVCSFYPVVSWDWDFDGLGSSGDENPDFVFAESGTYDVTLTVTDSEGCENEITVELPIGFDTEVTADDEAVCPGAEVNLLAEGIPFEDTECCFKLVLNDVWGDYWGSGIPNDVEIFADGVSIGTYTPTSFDPGSGTSDTVNLCFEPGVELEFVIHGEDSPAECSYEFLDEDLTEILSVDGSMAGTWVEGATETYTVDCGIDPPEYTYLWDNPAILSDETVADPVATVAVDTWFHVEITDPETGCTMIDSILITVNPAPDAVISGSETICEGDEGELTIEFTGPGPYDVNIDGPLGALPAITGIETSPYTLLVGEDGDYTITFVTGDGCDGTFSGTGTIAVIVPYDVDIESDATYCDGDPIADLTVVDTDGGTVNWYDNPDLTPPAIATGLSFTPPDMVGTFTYYAAETEGVLGCEGTADAVTITINPIPPAPAFTGDIEYCEGEDPTVLFGESSLGGELNWYDGPPPGGALLSSGDEYTPVLTPPSTVIYLTETAEGCEGESTEITLTVYPTPPAPDVSGDTEYCDGDVATALTATPSLGGTIEWQDATGAVLASGTTYTPTLVSGTTEIYVYETLGDCISEPTIIEINVAVSPTIDVPDELGLCIGDSIQVTAENNGYDIAWSDGQVGETVWLSPVITTTYTATASNPACGSVSDNVQITVYDLPEITVSPDTSIGLGGCAFLRASSANADFYEWTPAVSQCDSTDCSWVTVIPDRATSYTVVVTDENGCIAQDTIFVDLIGVMAPFVPNVFSPNDDGSNDVFKVYGPKLTEFNMVVYDRWGKKVFESKDQSDTWDGTFLDTKLAPQTFVYRVTAKNILDQEVILEGNVTIIQ